MPTPLATASLTGLASVAGIGLGIPYGEVGVLVVGFVALVLQAAVLATGTPRL